MDKLEEMVYYPTRVYAIMKLEFLEAVSAVSDKYLDLSRRAEHAEQNFKRTLMSPAFMHDPDVAYFAQYVSQTAWNILSSQGYDMNGVATFFTEMWTQEHRHMSSMDTHVHPRGAQISAFYFLKVPEKTSTLVLHDPRPGKVMINLFPSDNSVVSDASDPIVLSVKEGMLLFTNAWLPHSFSVNEDLEPMQFVHMNLGVMPAPATQEVEII
jgi:Putative 2OG-Fe(II) oxygenase